MCRPFFAQAAVRTAGLAQPPPVRYPGYVARSTGVDRLCLALARRAGTRVYEVPGLSKP